MKNDDLKSTLIDLGLSENEAKVYISSLVLGPSTVSKIAKEAGMKRTTVHSLIEPLKQLGLMKVEVKGWKNQYVAESPKRLEIILERKRNKFKEKLPDFMSLYNEEEKDSIIRYYEGLESLKTVLSSYVSSYKAGTEIKIIGDTTKLLNLDYDYFKKIFVKEVKAGIKKKLLLKRTEEAIKLQQVQKAEHSIVKFLPKDSRLTTNLRITHDKILIHHLIPPIMTLEIQNKHIVNMFHEFFEIMWDAIPNN